MNKNKLAVFIDGVYFIDQVSKLWKEYFHNAKQSAFPKLSAAEYGDLLESIIKGHLNDCDRELYKVFYYDHSILSWSNLRQPMGSDAPNIESKLSERETFNLKFMREFTSYINAKRKFKIKSANQSPLELRVPNMGLEEELKVLSTKDNETADSGLTIDLNRHSSDMQIGYDLATVSSKDQVDTIVIISADSRFINVSNLLRERGQEVIIEPLSKSIEYSLEKHFDWMSRSDIVIRLQKLTDYKLQKEPHWWKENN